MVDWRAKLRLSADEAMSHLPTSKKGSVWLDLEKGSHNPTPTLYAALKSLLVTAPVKKAKKVRQAKAALSVPALAPVHIDNFDASAFLGIPERVASVEKQQALLVQTRDMGLEALKDRLALLEGKSAYLKDLYMIVRRLCESAHIDMGASFRTVDGLSKT